MISLKQPSSELISWTPSKEPSLVTVREFRRPAVSRYKNQQRAKNARIFHKATTCVASKTAALSTAEDAIRSLKKLRAVDGRASGCPVMREFQQAQDHHPVLASTGCTRNFCQAGRATHTDEPRIGENRALEVVEKDAGGFLQELYQEKFFDAKESFVRRHDEVVAEIRAGACEGIIWDGRRQGEIGGNWHQTSAEIEFGIRRAWRNARKCIMRSHCEELKLCDLRHVTSSAEMARELVRNMCIAFNGGNVVPTVCVFPPRKTNSRGPMIWNHQILEFAGYDMGDGSVLGDPASVELTKAIIGIGWQPPTARSRWDLLPLVVMADNDVPVMIEIPSDLGRQIHIRHPRHQAAFEKLDLRWVAAPALARLGFDIGGVQYTAAPFIGWFMDAEIGVRDLADTFRYNTLPDVAKALGLLDKHFKDGVESLDDLPEYERQCILTQAQTELTYAVYWSYQQAKVSMSDTLTASMKWCRYDDNFKAKNGYRLPADPYWLAPPQGSIIPVWHRGGAPNYQPKPMISKHVQDPLKAWERERPQSFVAAEQLKDPHRKIHRPNLQCRSSTNDGILPAWTERHVHESIALTGERPVEGTNTIEALTVDEKFSISAIDPTPPRLSVSIYFCSAGTFAEKVALKLHLRLRDLAKIIPSVSVSSKIACLNELQLPPSCTDQIVLVVASSTGQGEVPTNGGRFITLCDGDTEKQLHNPRSSFKFAVFGNGDSRYAATYNGAAITIERKLQRLGGLPLLGSFHQGDTALQSTALQALNPWWAKLQPTLQDLATQSPKLRRTISDDVCNNGPMLMPSDIHTEAKSRFASQSQQLHSDFNSAKVISVNPPPRNDYQGTYLVTLDIGHMRYNDMDCIQILPVNAPAKVRRALRALGVTGSTPMSIDFADTISPTYSSFLTEYIDLESPLQNLDFLEQLDSASTSEEKLQSLSSLTALEHLNKSGLLPTSTETTTSILLSLPLLHPRTYSIASSLSHTTLPTPHPHPPSQNEKTNNHLDILVKPLPHGRFSQLFLSSAPPTLSLRYRLLPSAASRLLTLPPTTPLVVVATGAGFAPVRCLLQRCIALASSSTPQQTRQNEKPNIFLHIGLKPTDLPLFAPTLNDAAATGVLTSLSITPSNDAKMRVQDRLVERGVKEMVKEKGAWVFVCSGVDCARGVREVLGCAEEEGVVEGIGERWVEEVF